MPQDVRRVVEQNECTASMRFGRYAVVRPIGSGGMAEVFQCRLTGIGGFDKLVVIKRIRPDHVEDPQFVRMFLDEARIAAHLAHPNIVQVYEIDQVEGIPYISMEYVKGPTLGQLARRARSQNRPLRYEEVVRILASVCAGLSHAHTARDANGQALNVVHRDVTPQNILVGSNGVAKLVDFGVAKAAGRLAKTEAGTLKGKITYMAPEQIHSGDVIDHRADIFSIGVCLYALTTGMLPFRGNSEIDVLQAVIAGTFEKPRELIPDYPAELERIILWAMAKNLEERCPTALALQEALENFLAKSDTIVSERSIGQLVSELYEGDDFHGTTRNGTLAGLGKQALETRSEATPAPADSAAAPTAVLRPAHPAPTVRPIHTRKLAITIAAGVLLITGIGAVLFWPRSPEVLAAPVAGLSASAEHVEGSLPDPVEPDSKRTAESTAAVRAVINYLEEARRLLKEERYPLARELLARAAEGDDLDPRLTVEMALLRDRLETEEALHLARLRLKTRDYSGAIEAASRALTHDPAHVEADEILRSALRHQEATEAHRGRRRGTEPPRAGF